MEYILILSSNRFQVLNFLFLQNWWMRKEAIRIGFHNLMPSTSALGDVGPQMCLPFIQTHVISLLNEPSPRGLRNSFIIYSIPYDIIPKKT